MRYLPLLELRLRHPYYPGQRCPDLRVAADAATERALRNQRWVARAVPDGVAVFVSAAERAVEPLVGFPEQITLSFDLHAQHPAFSLFTELDAAPSEPPPLYVNSGASGALALAPAPAAARGPLARVEIRNVRPSWLDSGPAPFHLEFRARRALWVYYVVTPLLGEGALSIVDQRREPPDGEVVFSERPLTPAAAALDEIGAALLAEHPNQVARFVSTAPVACRAAPRARLELRQGASTLIESLPNPALESFSRLAFDGPATAAPESALFRVIKYFPRASTIH